MKKSSLKTYDCVSETEIKTTLVSRNITVLGHRTSIRLEPEMWNALREISMREKCTIHDLCALVSIRKNVNTSLTAAIRVFIMLYFRSAATEEGHSRASHGNFEFMKQRAKISNQFMTFFSRRGQGPKMEINYAEASLQNTALSGSAA